MYFYSYDLLQFAMKVVKETELVVKVETRTMISNSTPLSDALPTALNAGIGGDK